MIGLESVARDSLRILLEPQPGSDTCLYEIVCSLRGDSTQGVGRLAHDFFDSARRYAQLRGEWAFGNPAERSAIDADRSRAHDGFIASCNALSRYLAKEGRDVGWRETLGDHQRPENRRRIGDFACAVEFVRALSGR